MSETVRDPYDSYHIEVKRSDGDWLATIMIASHGLRGDDALRLHSYRMPGADHVSQKDFVAAAWPRLFAYVEDAMSHGWMDLNA